MFSMFIFIACTVIFYKMEKQVPLKFQSNFKIYYHNINSSNSSLIKLSDYIKKSGAEIITLLEVTPEIENVIIHNLSDYTYRWALARNDNFGFLILSKTDFKFEEVHEYQGIPVYVKFFIEKYNVKIYLLHLPPPLWREAFEGQREALAIIANEVNRNKRQSFLILGDFNMTTSSSMFQDFYHQLMPGFFLQESFYQGTWPSFVPSYLGLPIDHVLANRNFEIEMGHPIGSDHRSIIVRIDSNSKKGLYPVQR